MKISTKGRYGLKAVVEIALNDEEGCVSLRHISETLDISESYLEQIIATLKKANIVKSVRGSKGGYTLCKPPEEILLGDLVIALEGGIFLAKCVSGNTGCKDQGCGGTCSSECITAHVWERVFVEINNVLNNITLYDIINNNL